MQNYKNKEDREKIVSLSARGNVHVVCRYKDESLITRVIEERGKLKQSHERICITGNESKGWNVIIVWECQLKKAVLEDTVNRVAAEMRHDGYILRCDKDDSGKVG